MVNFGSTNSTSRNESSIWDEQSPHLQNLFKTGSGFFSNQLPGIKDYAANFANDNLGQATDAMSNLSSISSGTNLGMTTLANYMNPGNNPYLSDQVDLLGSDIGRNLKENILPGVRTEAGLTNNFSSSRGDIAEGMALQEGVRELTRGATGLRSNAYNQGSSAADAYVKNVMSASSQVPGAYSDVYNLGMNEYNAPWQLLDNYQRVVGGPTILGEGSSSSSGFNFGVG